MAALAGIALAAVLLLGNRVWPGIWLGAALVNFTVASSPFAAFAIGSGNTLEALAGAALVRHYIAREAPYFDRVRNVVKFVAAAALCSTVAATIGVSSLMLDGAAPWSDFARNWGTWWHGDAAGIIIVTPLILTWNLRHEIAWSPARILEAAGLALSLLLAFICTIVATGLMLSAAVSERTRAMDKLAQALDELREQASTDPLTGLSNRRYLWEFLLREWIRSRRREGALAVVMMDLDHFKRINDSFGHEAGDLVLKEIAAQLKAHVRGSDIACRFGGEEFALVLPDATLEAVQRRAEDIRAAVSRLELEHRGRLLGRLTASLGVAFAPDHAADPESLLRASDQALYEAKAGGRDRVVVSTAKSASA